MSDRAKKLIEQAMRGVPLDRLVEDAYGTDLSPDAPQNPSPVPGGDSATLPLSGDMSPTPSPTPSPSPSPDESASPTPSPSPESPIPSPESPSPSPMNATDAVYGIADAVGGTVDYCDAEGEKMCCGIIFPDDSSVCFKIYYDSAGDIVVDGVRWQMPRPKEDHLQFRHDDYSDKEEMSKDIGKWLKSTKK